MKKVGLGMVQQMEARQVITKLSVKGEGFNMDEPSNQAASRAADNTPICRQLRCVHRADSHKPT